jgi:hypothetical protein
VHHQGAIRVFAKTAIELLELTRVPLRTYLDALTIRLLSDIAPNLNFFQAAEYRQGEAAAGRPAGDPVP